MEKALLNLCLSTRRGAGADMICLYVAFDFFNWLSENGLPTNDL
jgi:hypothetical protein